MNSLLERDVFEPSPWGITSLFKAHNFQAIGEQMQWLNQEAARFEQYTPDEFDPSVQTAIEQWTPAPEPDIDPPDVDDQSDWGDWANE